jgi:acetyl esterase/lipase
MKRLALSLLVAPLFAVAGEYQMIPDQPYVTNNHEHQVMDIYLPVDNGATARPLVIMFHGGCFTGGRKSNATDGSGMEDTAALYASEGFVVANVEYRKSPAFPYPASWMDAMQAARFMIANAGTYNINTSQVVSLGESAGATIASLLALKPWFTTSWTQDSLSRKVNVAVSQHGRMDFMHDAFPDDLSVMDCAERWLNKYRESDPNAFSRASLLNMVNSWTPKFYMQHGLSDNTVLPYHGEVMRDKLHSFGRQSVFINEFGGHTAFARQQQNVMYMIKGDFGMPR